MNTKKTPQPENRDGKAILLKLTPSDRERAEAVAAAEYLSLTTWTYKIFKEALDHAESVTKSSRNVTQ